MKKPGKIVIISSPSGGGKTSICRKLLSPTRKRLGWQFSVSYTTRAMRTGEKNGREYHFVSDDEFQKMVKAELFAEHFKVHLYKYGTPRKPLEKVLKSGGVMLLDVDVQGAKKIKKEYPEAITIFVMPPSAKELRIRLRQRGTETKKQLQVRYNNAAAEMRLFDKFEYAVINKELNTAVTEVLSIINCHHCRTDKMTAEQKKKIRV